MPVLLDRRMMDGTSRSRLGVDLAGRETLLTAEK